MPSAMSRRLDARQAMLDAHYSRTDLIRYDDRPPQIEATSTYIDGRGNILTPSELKVNVSLVPEGNLRLVTLSGIGDALWTRGVLRGTLDAGMRVWIDTPFEWCFWDFEGQPGFQFWSREHPANYGLRTATYLGSDLSKGATVYGAMSQRCRTPPGNFRLPIHADWSRAADAVLDQIKPQKPLMIYRPLLNNHGRRSVSSRNPDHQAYAQIFASIRDQFHVISVANSCGETIVHADPADTTFHHGQLPITTVIGLMSKALVYTNPGMALVAAAAIGAPVIGVFGGYEDVHNYQDTVIYGRSLLLDPINPCRCMSDSHACDKRMNIPDAIKRAQAFVS